MSDKNREEQQEVESKESINLPPKSGYPPKPKPSVAPPPPKDRK
jgi:hypothetical protein